MIILAKDLAKSFLEEELPKRWRHTCGVARQMVSILDKLPLTKEEKEILVDSAWLHDIGYSKELVISQGIKYDWHSLVGVSFLATLYPPEVVNLVAWHTSAEEEAEILGMSVELSFYPKPKALLLKTLTYADLTTSPEGEKVSLIQKVEEIHSRYNPSDTPYLAIDKALPRLLLITNYIGLRNKK